MYFFIKLLKVVIQHDLSVLSMSVTGFQRKGGRGELKPVFFWDLFNLQSPLMEQLQDAIHNGCAISNDIAELETKIYRRKSRFKFSYEVFTAHKNAIRER